MWRTLLLLLSLAAGSRQLSMTEFSVPAALEAGEDAYLQCKYDLLKNESDKALFVKWWWTPLNNSSDNRYPLYQRIAGRDAVIIHRLPNHIEILENDGLKIANVTPNVSGTYECEVSNIEEVRQHQKMIVLSIGTGPLLNVTVTEEDESSVLVTCEAFDIAPRPDIVITLNEEKVETSGNVTELKDGLYEVYEYANFSLAEADNGEFRCEIFFEDDDIPHAPYESSMKFIAPTVSTPEPEETSTEPSAAASQPHDNGSNKIGDSWILVTSFSLLLLLLHNYRK